MERIVHFYKFDEDEDGICYDCDTENEKNTWKYSRSDLEIYINNLQKDNAELKIKADKYDKVKEKLKRDVVNITNKIGEYTKNIGLLM